MWQAWKGDVLLGIMPLHYNCSTTVNASGGRMVQLHRVVARVRSPTPTYIRIMRHVPMCVRAGDLCTWYAGQGRS